LGALASFVLSGALLLVFFGLFLVSSCRVDRPLHQAEAIADAIKKKKSKTKKKQ
jgi:hypothetical protein